MSFTIFGLEIYYYGVIIACGILVAFLLGLWLIKKVNYKDDIAYLMLLLTVPIGIICARFYYVLFSDWSHYQTFFDVINIRAGGMAIYGGVIGGSIGLFIASRIKKCGFFTLSDIVVICLIIAQSIGRWGNFTNQEAHGFAVDFNFFPLTVMIDGQAYLATFFYESFLNLIAFGVLLYIFLRQNKKGTYKWGTTSAWYLILYGAIRACIEPLRTDSLYIFGTNPIVFNRVSFMLSLALVIVGVVLLFAVKRGWISQENKQCLNTSPTDTKEAK